MKKLIPVMILGAAAVAAYMVWKRSRPATSEGEAATENAAGGGFLEDFFKKFGNVAEAAPAPPAQPPLEQAVAVDNGV